MSKLLRTNSIIIIVLKTNYTKGRNNFHKFIYSTYFHCKEENVGSYSKKYYI